MNLAFPYLCGLLADKPTGLSRAMHSAGFLALGLPYVYLVFDTVDTEAGFRSMRDLGFKGYSLTIPHKEKGMGLVDQLSPEAKEIAAVNTVINDGEKLVGYNTDWIGILKALAEVEFEAQGRRALILGAGGAARGAVFALKKLNVGEIVVVNRNQERSQKMADDFGVIAGKLDTVATTLQEFDLLINATPIGSHLSGEQGFPFDLELIHSKLCVFDMVTKDTLLIAKAKNKGCKVVLGIRMLLHQAVKQFELFTGEEAPLQVMEQGLLKELGKV